MITNETNIDKNSKYFNLNLKIKENGIKWNERLESMEVKKSVALKKKEYIKQKEEET